MSEESDPTVHRVHVPVGSGRLPPPSGYPVGSGYPPPAGPPLPRGAPGAPGAPPAAWPPPAGREAPASSPFARGRAYDRVGGSRLTGFGVVVLAVLVIGAGRPPQSADRGVMVVIWATLLGLMLLGCIWPMVAVRQIRVSVTSPRDLTVGEQARLSVTLTGRASGCEVRALDPTGSWRRSVSPASGELSHLADRRGVFPLVRVEVRVTAPLGILAAHRVHTVALEVPVEVAPRPLMVSWRPAPSPREGGAEPTAGVLPGVDLFRSVRPYTVGDPAHLVHWPSTARTGALVVREMEPPTPVGQAVVVDLRGLGPDIEHAASYALGAARSVLAMGGNLVLCTAEIGGPVTGLVRTPIDAGRRLARAVPGVPGEPPLGWPVVEIGR